MNKNVAGNSDCKPKLDQEQDFKMAGGYIHDYNYDIDEDDHGDGGCQPLVELTNR